MRVAGMSVLERILRDHARRGADSAVIRGDGRALPPLPDLPIDVTVAAYDAPVPEGATRVRGDELLGVHIADEHSRRAVEWALLQTCRRPYDGPGDKYISRAISLRITRFVSRFEVTPNQVTIVAGVLGLAAFALACVGTFPAISVAGVLMIAQVILDSVDGELSRIRHMGSKLGMWLDNLSDDVIDNLLVIGLGIGIGGTWATVGVLAALGRGVSAVVTYLGARAAGHPGDVMAFRWWFEHDVSSPTEAYDKPLSLGTAMRALGRRDSYMLVFGASCILAIPQVAFALGVVNCAVYFSLAVIHLVARKGRP